MLTSKGTGRSSGQTSTVDILRQLIKVWLLASYPRLRYEVDEEVLVPVYVLSCCSFISRD